MKRTRPSLSLFSALPLVALASGILGLIACGGDDEAAATATPGNAETAGQYVPGEAQPMPPLPPGAGTIPPDPPATAMPTSTTDSGPPPVDSGPKDAADAG